MRSFSVREIAFWNEAQISATSWSRQRRDLGRRLAHGRLQAGKREIEPGLADQSAAEN